MQSERKLAIPEGGSAHATLGQLIVSVADTDYLAKEVELVVGRVGFPNVERSLRTGGAVLFETPDDGLLEVRVIGVRHKEVDVLVSQVSPVAGMCAGFAHSEADNAPFVAAEVARIGEGLQEVRNAVGQRRDLRAAQIDFVSRKLDEMQQAAERLGRKDWINLVIGTMTTTIVSAALGPDAGRFIFQALATALSWLFSGPLKLLP